MPPPPCPHQPSLPGPALWPLARPPRAVSCLHVGGADVGAVAGWRDPARARPRRSCIVAHPRPYVTAGAAAAATAAPPAPSVHPPGRTPVLENATRPACALPLYCPGAGAPDRSCRDGCLSGRGARREQRPCRAPDAPSGTPPCPFARVGRPPPCAQVLAHIQRDHRPAIVPLIHRIPTGRPSSTASLHGT